VLPVCKILVSNITILFSSLVTILLFLNLVYPLFVFI